jgi:hypothetical protein
MWSKVLKPAPAPGTSRPVPQVKPQPAAVQPTRVLQSSRAPAQLSFEFRRG